MIASKDKISIRQAVILYLLMVYSPAIRIFPVNAASQARYAGWVSPLLAVLPFIGLVYIMHALFQNNKDANLSDLILKIFGRYLGRVILSFFLIWMVILFGIYIRYYAERFLSALLPNTSKSFFAVTILAVSFYVARGGIVKFVRTVEFLFTLFSIVYFSLFLLTIPNIKLFNLFPVTHYDIIPLIKASSSIVGIWVYFTVVFFFGEIINDKEHIRRFGFQGFIYLVIVNIMLLIQTIGSYGYTVIKRLPLPYFITVKGISLLDTIERIESVALSFWVIVDFAIITFFLYVCMNVVGSLFSLPENKHMASPIAVFGFIITFYIGRDTLELRAFSNYIGLPVNIMLFFVFPFILFLVGKLRKMI